MKHLYILTSLLVIFSFSGRMLAQEPLTDRIVIEFMEPGDPDAEARNYNLLPWPEEAKAPAYKAAEIWASYLEITVPIRVKFGWCDYINAAGEGAPFYNYQYTDGYYYPLPLINQLLGYDRNPSVADIICVFNGSGLWYFGLDSKLELLPDPINPGAQIAKTDFLSTALHEICHGLGIGGNSFNINEGKGTWGGAVGSIPTIYELFIGDNNSNELINTHFYPKNSAELATILTSNKVFWLGNHAITANNGNPVKIYAPYEWSSSSISHLDEIHNKNNIIAAGARRLQNPGNIVLGMLQDIGWTLKSIPTANEKISTATLIEVYASMNQVVIDGIKNNIRVTIFDISGRAVYSGFGPNRVTLPTGVYIVHIDNQSFKINLR